MKLVHFSIRVTPQLKRLIVKEAKVLGLGTSKRVRDILESRYAYELTLLKR